MLAVRKKMFGTLIRIKSVIDFHICLPAHVSLEHILYTCYINIPNVLLDQYILSWKALPL